MSFYHSCMRHASVVLFWMAVLLFLFMTIVSLRGLWPEISQNMANIYTESQESALDAILRSLASGLSSAVLPLFGAALLWRLDKHWSAEAAE
jgi:hypothetical protein